MADRFAITLVEFIPTGCQCIRQRCLQRRQLGTVSANHAGITCRSSGDLHGLRGHDLGFRFCRQHGGQVIGYDHHSLLPHFCGDVVQLLSDCPIDQGLNTESGRFTHVGLIHRIKTNAKGFSLPAVACWRHQK